MYPDWLKGDCHFFVLGVTIYIFLYFVMYWKIIRMNLLNLTLTFLTLSLTIPKIYTTLRIYSCTVEPTTTSLCLHIEWLIINLNSWLLKYERYGNKCCGRAVTGLDPIIDKVFVSFYIIDWISKLMINWILIWNMLLYQGMFFLSIFPLLLIFTCYYFSLWITVWKHAFIMYPSRIPLFHDTAV